MDLCLSILRKPVQSADLSRITCFACNKTGHYSRDCMDKSGNNNQTVSSTTKSQYTDCAYCHRKGHSVTNCFKRQNDEKNKSNLTENISKRVNYAKMSGGV